jgi:hypothetical protein
MTGEQSLNNLDEKFIHVNANGDAPISNDGDSDGVASNNNGKSKSDKIDWEELRRRSVQPRGFREDRAIIWSVFLSEFASLSHINLRR